MAAVRVRHGTSFVTNSLFRRASAFQTQGASNLKNFLPQGYFWSQLKCFQTVATEVSQQVQPKLSRWRVMWLLGAGGFGPLAFLGFSFGKKKEDQEGDPLLRVFREAKVAQMKQDFHVAEIRYHDALKVADEMLKLKKITQRTLIFARTNIYDSLADMALMRGELEKAEGLYKETMKLCLQQGLAQDDNALVELSIKIASIYAMLDRKEEAETGLQFCIQAQEAKVAAASHKATTAGVAAVAVVQTSRPVVTKDELIAASSQEDGQAEIDENLKKQDTEALLGLALETYGRFLMGNRRIEEAVPVLEKACKTAENVLGSEARQYLILLNDLATAHILLKQFDVAMSTLNKAIELGTKAESPELPVLYCNLGAALLRMSKTDDAEMACNRGRDLAISGHHSLALKMSQNCLTKIGQVKAKKA